MAKVVQPGTAPASSDMITATDGAIIALLMAGAFWAGSIYGAPPKIEVREVTKTEYVLKPVITPACDLENYATSRDGGDVIIRRMGDELPGKSQAQQWREYDRENARRERQQRATNRALKGK